MRSARPAPPTPRAYARADSPPWRLRLRLLPRRTCRKEASMLEGSTISSIIYPTLRINYCLLLLIRGLQSPGPGFFEPFPAYQTLPDTLFFSFPALADRCYCGLPPSAPRWGQVPGVVRRLKFPFDCCSDENRCSCSYSRNRCSHSTSKHRHSGSRCCCHDRPHGLWGGATFQMQKYYFQIII